MGGGLMAAKLCDSCKSATATLYCRPDSAFLCLTCDSKVHAANKLASRHARVWVCEVCEHAPASVTCKADAAHLCVSCDLDIHSANPLARRHERIPLVPFLELTDSPSSVTDTSSPSAAAAATATAATAAAVKSNAINKLFGEDYYSDLEAEEAEAASWLVSSIPNPKKESGYPNKAIDYLFADDEIDPYLDLDFSADPKAGVVDDDDDVVSNGAADCVVPEQKVNHHQPATQHSHQPAFSFSSYGNHFADGFGGSAACKPFSLAYHTTQQSLSYSMSSSSLEVGVVPDANAITDISTAGVERQMNLGGINREARVLRYREKRKNRKFEKTIRYASRKAYAETRPRIKGRFAKRSDVEAAVGVVESPFASSHQPLVQDPGYGVVPSF